MLRLSFLSLLVLVSTASADFPVECHFEDIVGQWTFFETARNGSSQPTCDSIDDVLGKEKYQVNLTLSFPNKVHDDFGNQGTWTMIYDQGFEVRVRGRSYFAFSKFTTDDDKVVSHCGETRPGWSRDNTIRNWSCYIGKKVVQPKPKARPNFQVMQLETQSFVQSEKLVREINDQQSSWTAKMYPQLEGLSMADVYRMRGGHRVRRPLIDNKRPNSSLETELRVAMLPEAFDWRNVSGINYVRPVKNQGPCGSCYAFASIGVIESQLLIHSAATENFDLSAEDIIGCSHLSQGCDGGFAYLVAGRYAQESGMVSARCVPYFINPLCTKHRQQCRKIYTEDYGYVGGFFGAGNEDEMLLALVNHGPLAVGIEVGSDFMQYKSGIYHKVKTPSIGVEFDPFEETNHAVLLVGYGVSDEGEKYWIVQNSWGTGWGMKGYVYVRRGTDEIGIESMAMHATAYS